MQNLGGQTKSILVFLIVAVKIGVPQGSLLGPMLFVTFVNDLPYSVNKGEVFIYTDDTTMYVIGKTVHEVVLTMQVALDQVQLGV